MAEALPMVFILVALAGLAAAIGAAVGGYDRRREGR